MELEAVEYSSTQEGVEIIDEWSKRLMCDNLEREVRSLFEIFTEEATTCCENICS